jgi:RNA polymerase sigma-70 factor (ECF subfamily)
LKHTARRGRIDGVSGSVQGQAAVAAPRGTRGAAAAGGADSELLRAAQEGSADAVETLVRRYWDVAHRAAYLIVQDSAAAEDIAQEAVLAAVQRIHRFDRRRPFGPWLHRIVANRSIDWVRARKRRAEVATEAADAALVAATRADRLPEDVVAALAMLDPEDRAVVVLRHLLDYNSREIARMLGVPPGTVRTRLRRSLQSLRPLLADREEEPS